jgi:hypothetical protein
MGWGNNWVLRAEGQFEGGHITGSTNNACDVGCRTTVDFFGTVTPAIGYLLNPNLLASVNGGWAFGKIHAGVGDLPGVSSFQNGWTVGAGVEWPFLPTQKSERDSQERELAKLESPLQDSSPDPTSPKQDFSYLTYYAYAEVLPDKKPADTVLEALRGIPVGTPVEEIKRVSDAFGLDFVFMKAVAKIESDFDPKQRTGSYIGLFQLSKREFEKYGSGNITHPRDNAVAAAYKLSVEAKLFELDTHKKASLSDVYLVHQQGVQGAAEHVNNPERVAWESMCATDEGREKGEKWCKRAIWGNTLPAIKRVWKSVSKLTSGAFVAMWQQRVDHFYARYTEATAEKK